jgi:hypothetical protein
VASLGDMKFWRGFPGFALALLGAVLVVGLAWVLGPGAAWVLAHFDGVRGLAGKDLAAALDAVRGRALAIATGLIALVAVYYTARNADTARRTFRLGEQGHVTDRYTKAIEQLGSDKLDIRLGGIYALERIARDSARDHSTVMEVLAAFVREHSQDVETDTSEDGKPPGLRLRTDLQAAVTVIGRRDSAQDTSGVRLNLSGADLAGADLAGADLAHAKLITTDLTGANLTPADLTGADLRGAKLTDAHLSVANLTNANLSGANLTRAYLAGANLSGTKLTNARLTGANLTGANLEGADLDGVVGLPEHRRSVPSMSLSSVSDMVPPVKGETATAEGSAAE